MPSNAVALKVLLVELVATRPDSPGPVSVKVPESVAVMIDDALSRLSTLMSLINEPALSISTEVNVPSEGSNWSTVKVCVQSVGAAETDAVRVNVVGAVLIVLSVEKE